MVRAHERLGVALLGATYRVAPVRQVFSSALTEPSRLPHGEHVVAPNGRLEEVTWLRYLRLVAQELPGSAEDQLHLPLEDFIVREDATIDFTALQRHPAIELVVVDL